VALGEDRSAAWVDKRLLRRSARTGREARCGMLEMIDILADQPNASSAESGSGRCWMASDEVIAGALDDPAED
jgi:hypothetical protein